MTENQLYTHNTTLSDGLASSGDVNLRLAYQHEDPHLTAHLTFYQENFAWVLCYYRQGHAVGSSLYQSRATAELLLCSLGYKELK